MKFRTIRILVALVVCSLSLPNIAHEITQPHIAVYGTAKQEVAPDLMLWTLSVVNKGSELESVSKLHTERVSGLLELLEKQKVDENKIQTTNMNFGENIVYRNNSQVKEGYIASTTVTFVLNDFEEYESTWLSLSKMPSVSVNNVSYDYSKRIELQNETRIQALLAAKDKAVSLATTMDLELGEVISIIDESNDIYSANQNVVMSVARNSFSENAVAPGTISITMRVKLVVGLISK